MSSDSGQDLCPVEVTAHLRTSLPQSDHIEDRPPEPGTETRHKSEHVLSPNRKLEEDSALESGAGSERVSSSISQIEDSSSSSVSVIGSEAELTQELHMSHSVKPSSSFRQDRCPIKSPAQVQNSPPQVSLIEDYAPELGTKVKHKSGPISLPNSHPDNGPALEFRTDSEAETDQKQHLSNPFKLSSQPEQDLCPIKTAAHAHSSNLSPSSIWIANNSNAIISKAKVLAHPDNSVIELQYAQFIQPTAKSFQTLILPLHYRTSPESRRTERGPRPDMLTALERYLDDLDALSVEVSADADT